MEQIRLMRGKEAPIRNKHHWIFSKAIEQYPKGYVNGEIYKVVDFRNQVLGHAYFNDSTAIVGRMLNFTNEDPIKSIEAEILNAYNLRKTLINESETNAFRLINSEGDRIPGLTIDKYGNSFVIQVATLGIEKLKPKIIDILIKNFSPELIFEKSNMPARKVEGMESFEGILYDSKGSSSTKVHIIENNNKFEIDFKNSHKTGFYLDQREMRALIGSISKDKNVLNCFSYTGGFSVYAAKNNAKVVSVDISKEVIAQAKINFEINDLSLENHEFLATDVFHYLENYPIENFDIVILDPPAFAKKKQDIAAARSGYRRLNRTALKKMKKGSILLTCSCSYHMDEVTFLSIINESAGSAGRNIKILGKHRHAFDHPINLFHGELDYLKSFLLFVE